MKDFIITLLFGWLGVHKFMQKKYGVGILYLFTLGLFGIGWMIDIVMAFVRMTTGKQLTPEMQKSNEFSVEGKYELPENNLKRNILKSNSQPKFFTKAQLEGMTKAGILELAAGLGYTMTILEKDTKDRIVEDFIAQQEKQPSIDNKKWLIKTFNTEIVGTFAKCDLDKSYERSEIICSLKPNSKLDLEYWEYKGEPAFYVCNKGLDAGCVPAIISKTLHDVYGDCEIVVALRGEAEYNNHDDLIQKIRIDVYK